jgi:hypothetical protein
MEAIDKGSHKKKEEKKMETIDKGSHKKIAK